MKGGEEVKASVSTVFATEMFSPTARRTIGFIVGLMVLAWPLCWQNELYGTAFLMIGLPLCMALLPLRVSQIGRLLLAYAFVAGVVGFAVSTDALSGPDALGYFAQIGRFDSVGQFFRYIYEVVREQWILGTAYLAFPVLYLPYYGALGLQQPESIAVLNALFWILAVGAATWMFQRWSAGRGDLAFLGGACILALLSPAAMYFASTFGKDAGATFVAVLLAVCVLRKRWIFAAFLLYFGTMLRPYTVVIAATYVLLARAPTYVLATAAAAAIAIVFVATGFRADAVVNIGLVGGFLFLSPNPLNPDNWIGHLAPLAIEGIILGGLAAISLPIMLSSHRHRPLYFRIFLSVLIYAAALVLVGYVHARTHGMPYGIGTAGDNMLRKKLPIVPILYLHATLTLRVLFGSLLARRSSVTFQPMTMAKDAA